MRQDVADDGLLLIAAQGVLPLLFQIIPLPLLVLDDGDTLLGQGVIDFLDQVEDAAPGQLQRLLKSLDGYSMVILLQQVQQLITVLEGTLLTVTPALCQPFMRVITGGDTVAMGHTGNIGYALAGWCGKWFGNKEHSTEDINVPKSMSFLRDSTVSITIVMAIVYIILALMTGQQFVEENLSKGTNYIIYAIVQAGTFAAGFAVVLQGVRMILAEIVPAFQGIAMKLVPNSKPALDVPIIFPYAPNAVLLGFFVSFIVGTISMFGMVALGTVVIIPGVVGHFFCGAAAAIYGNAKGGRRGAIIGAAVNSLLISWLPLFILPVLGNLSLASSTFADTDYLIPGIILGNIGALGETALLVGIIGFTALVCLASKLMKEPEKA